MYGYPGQGYGPGGYNQFPQGQYPPQGQNPPQGQWGGYNAPPGPPPGHYQPPSGPPPSHYAPPQGPPPSHRQDDYIPPPGPLPSHYNSYRPPSHPPPSGYDSYGYFQQGGGYNRGPAPPPPPSEHQQFGQGAPQGYTFQYSQCTGRRKALLIGINYFGQEGELRGCINDTKNLSNFLMERYNYKREDMVILTDDQQNPVMQPTRDNIIRACHWLVKDAQPNDSLFLHYSGHGGQTEDLDGDEDDGFDEVIYPVDFRQTSHIVDDDLHNVVVKPLQPGVRLTAIFDSCHSGSVLDLPYIYSTKGMLKEPNLAKEAGSGLLSAAQSYIAGDMGGLASTVFKFAKTALKGDSAYKKTMATKTSPADVIMWSGSKDDQTSADATIAAQATGAMSWAFIEALKQNPQQSYVQMLNSIRDVLATKYSQKPQLSCSHPLDTNLLFVM